MKTLANLEYDIDKFGKKVINNVINAQRDTADKIWADVIEMAPYVSGDYVSTIQKGETEYNKGVVSTQIYTEATVSALFTGNEYNLGELLEIGTNPHAIPNAWGKGYTYGHIGSDGKFHKGTMDPDWHPGSLPRPHFLPALNKNVALYKSNIDKAVKEAK